MRIERYLLFCGMWAMLWLNALATEESVVATRLRRDVTALAGEIGARSVFQKDSLAKAATYISNQFESAGWSVERQTYRVEGIECANLIVELQGRTKPDEIVVVGAHYDTVPQTPGADDNASGVAVLLALARDFAGAKTERTLRLVAFANEEPIYFQSALMGSLVYAKSCQARGDKIVGMLSLETMGYFQEKKGTQKYPFPLSWFYPSRGNFLAVVGNVESRALVNRVAKTAGALEILPIEKASLPGKLQGVGWSDHWSFWQVGYPAVMVTDTAPFRNPHYHKSTDTPDTLNYARLALATRAVRAATEDLLNRR